MQYTIKTYLYLLDFLRVHKFARIHNIIKRDKKVPLHNDDACMTSLAKLSRIILNSICKDIGTIKKAHNRYLYTIKINNSNIEPLNYLFNLVPAKYPFSDLTLTSANRPAGIETYDNMRIAFNLFLTHPYTAFYDQLQWIYNKIEHFKRANAINLNDYRIPLQEIFSECEHMVNASGGSFFGTIAAAIEPQKSQNVEEVKEPTVEDDSADNQALAEMIVRLFGAVEANARPDAALQLKIAKKMLAYERRNNV